MQIHRASIGQSDNVIRAKFSLIFHGKDNDIQYATKHNIEDNRIREGQYVSPESVLDMIASALPQKNTNLSGFVNPNLIYQDSQQHIWYQQASVKTLKFKTNNTPSEIKRACPALLYYRNDSNKLRIFALATNERPDASTKLYHAPLCNINSQGTLCLGQAKLSPFSELNLTHDENTFWDYHATHVNHNNTLNINNNISTAAQVEYWEQASDSQFDNNVLVSANLTLQDLLKI